MNPLLFHSNTNSYNINGKLCTYIEMFCIHTCCNHILSAAELFRGQEATCADPGFLSVFIALSIFYSLQRGSNGFIAKIIILILYQGSRGGPLFSRVVQLFPGEGPNANFYRNSYNFCFPWGVSIHTWSMSS